MRTTFMTGFALLLGCLALQGEQPKVGTFDNRAVALAFYNSDVWAGVLKAKKAEHATAKQSGDTQKVEELEKWGQSQQDLAHKQVFGSAPITNVLEHLKPGLAEIAKAGGVSIVVGEVLYADAAVQRVDVTMHVADWLKSSSRTKGMMKDLMDKAR